MCIFDNMLQAPRTAELRLGEGVAERGIRCAACKCAAIGHADGGDSWVSRETTSTIGHDRYTSCGCMIISAWAQTEFHRVQCLYHNESITLRWESSTSVQSTPDRLFPPLPPPFSLYFPLLPFSSSIYSIAGLIPLHFAMALTSAMCYRCPLWQLPLLHSPRSPFCILDYLTDKPLCRVILVTL